MKKIVLSLGLALGSMLSVSASSKAEPVNPDSTGFKFTDEIVIKTTPVKDQNKTGTCWSFSTVSFFENVYFYNITLLLFILIYKL